MIASVPPAYPAADDGRLSETDIAGCANGEHREYREKVLGRETGDPVPAGGGGAQPVRGRVADPAQEWPGGAGPHFCLGAHLARREITAMPGELMRRVPTIRTAGEPDRLLPGPRSAAACLRAMNCRAMARLICRQGSRADGRRRLPPGKGTRTHDGR
jgi:hypothetical protein